MTLLILPLALLTPQDTPGPSLVVQELLPPALPWDGASRSLAVPADDPWITPCEASGFVETPGYGETMAWLRRLCDAAPELELLSIGETDEGRSIAMVVASREGATSPAELARNGRPTVLAQAGIHSGEIDGKDAGMMLLRDLTVGESRRALLDGANLLLVPILNADGHENASPFGRINQRGPASPGWRTNGRNLNLNRDYAKLDTPEVRAIVRAVAAWAPDLYLDLHVTDGIDYQYDVTFGANGPQGASPATARWLEGTLRPAVSSALQAAGHVPGPLIFAADANDLSAGLVEWTSGPRFSNGWGDLAHVPTVLVENHSLKPYEQRVLGTYVFLQGVLELLGTHADALRAAVREDRARRPEELVLSWAPREGEPETMRFLGVAHETVLSPVSGARHVRWLGRPETFEVPYLRFDRPAETLALPAAYWILPAWSDVIERLELHGVELERLDRPREVLVERLHLVDPRLDPEPYEGRVRARAATRSELGRVRFEAGSVRVPLDQPRGELAAILLEPASADSFFQWGFFHGVLQRTEYAEAYVLEPLAERLLAADAELAAAFRRRLEEDEAFAADPGARLEWFYERSPFADARHDVLPVAREPRAR